MELPTFPEDLDDKRTRKVDCKGYHDDPSNFTRPPNLEASKVNCQ